MLSFMDFEDELEDLVTFLTSNTWEFHGDSNPSAEKIIKNFEEGFYNGEDTKTFWILLNDELKIGVLRIFDLTDSTPLFDIRISNAYRGKGIGVKVIQWLTNHIFTQYKMINRIEGYTRQDNYAMRTVFYQCNFVKEAYHRKSWKDRDGNLYDSVGYCILREDWIKNETTIIDWNDFKY